MQTHTEAQVTPPHTHTHIQTGTVNTPAHRRALLTHLHTQTGRVTSAYTHMHTKTAMKTTKSVQVATQLLKRDEAEGKGALLTGLTRSWRSMLFIFSTTDQNHRLNR